MAVSGVERLKLGREYIKALDSTGRAGAKGMKKKNAGTLLPEAGRDKRQGEAPPRPTVCPGACAPPLRSPPRPARTRPASRRAWRARHSGRAGPGAAAADRKSTRLNSSHVRISYAVFCLKK